jgi:hypothetical protein
MLPSKCTSEGLKWIFSLSIINTTFPKKLHFVTLKIDPSRANTLVTPPERDVA